MTNRGKAELKARVERLRTRFYAGEISRDAAFKGISAMCCEMIELEEGQPRELRALMAAAYTVEYMEPAV